MKEKEKESQEILSGEEEKEQEKESQRAPSGLAVLLSVFHPFPPGAHWENGRHLPAWLYLE